MPVKTTIEPLSLEVLPELLTFERDNRAYFAEWVADRGDDYFSQFTERNEALLEEQSAGRSFFFVVRDEEGRLVGRINLVDLAPVSVSLGYRIAQEATGNGHAGRAVLLASAFARDRELQTITAMTTLANRGSQRVLERAGFIEVVGSPASIVINRVEHEMLHVALDLKAGR